MAFENLPIGNIGRVASGINAYRNLFKGNFVEALSGGLFGEGGFFGGQDSDRDITVPGLSIPEQLKKAGINISGAGGGSGFESFRDAAVPLEQQIRSIGPALTNIAAQFNKFGLNEEADAFLQTDRELTRTPTGHQDAININQSKVNLIASGLQALDLFRGLNPDDPAVKRERKGPDRPKSKKVDGAKRTVLKAARQFARIPIPGRRKSAAKGFVSAGSFGDISELSQEADRIVPSGFISKQATTSQRSLALDRLR